MIEKVSAVILTRNNEKTIKKCLDSIENIVDEMIIIDDGSKDKTLDIVRGFKNTKIFLRELKNDFASQRNFGIKKAKNELIMHIDSDEYLSFDLVKSLKSIKLNLNKCYMVERVNQNFHGETIESLHGRPLIARRSLKFKGNLHEKLEVKNSFKLTGLLVHDCWIGLNDFVNDINVYSSRKAEIWFEQGRDYSTGFLLVRQITAFFFYFFIRFIYEKRFLNGSSAFFYCLYWSSEELLVGLKYLELKLKRTKNH